MREYFKRLSSLGSVAPASAWCILGGRVAAVTRAGVVDRSNEEDRMMRQPQADALGGSVSPKALDRAPNGRGTSQPVFSPGETNEATNKTCKGHLLTTTEARALGGE